MGPTAAPSHPPATAAPSSPPPTAAPTSHPDPMLATAALPHSDLMVAVAALPHPDPTVAVAALPYPRPMVDLCVATSSPSFLWQCPRPPIQRRGSIEEAGDGGTWWLPCHVQLEYDASERDGPLSEIFREKLKEFTDNAGADVLSLSSLFSEVGKKADALIKYFGEDPVRCPFEQDSSLGIFEDDEHGWESDRSLHLY